MWTSIADCHWVSSPSLPFSWELGENSVLNRNCRSITASPLADTLSNGASQGCETIKRMGSPIMISRLSSLSPLFCNLSSKRRGSHATPILSSSTNQFFWVTSLNIKVFRKFCWDAHKKMLHDAFDRRTLRSHSYRLYS